METLIVKILIIGVLSLVFIGLLIFIVGALVVSKTINKECEQEEYKLQHKKYYKWNGKQLYSTSIYKNGEGYFIDEKDIKQYLKGQGIKLIWCREELPKTDQLGNNNCSWK